MTKTTKRTVNMGCKPLSALAVALCMAASGSMAAGIGKLTVLSPLGQPLRAELEIVASKDELSSMTARLASAAAYKQAGIEFAPAVAGLKFAIEKKKNGNAILRVSTDRPVNDPFLDVLVELNWSSGRLVREYTVLLDPPEIVATGSRSAVVMPVVPPQELADVAAKEPEPAAAAPASDAAQVKESPGVDTQAKPEDTTKAVADAPVVTNEAATPPAPAQQKVEVRTVQRKKPSSAPNGTSSPNGSSGGSAGTRAVVKGDTLRKIANETKPDDVSLDQMLVALVRSNPAAFSGGNMNRLRAGRILEIPASEEVAAISPKEARKVVVAQAHDFNAYRRRLAAAVTAAPESKEAAAKQVSEGKIASAVEEKVAPLPAGKDKLEVSRTEANKDTKDAKNIQGRISALEEDIVARDRALKEANSRVVELERNLNDLQQLAQLKSQTGAQLQQQSQAQQAKKAAPETQPAVAAKPTVPEVAPAAQPAPVPGKEAKPAEALPGKTVEAPAPSSATPPVKSATESMPPVGETKPAPEVKPAEKTEPATTTEVKSEVKPEIKPELKPEVKPEVKPEIKPEPAPVEKKASPPPAKPKPAIAAKPVEPESSFIDENPLLVYGGAGALALTLGGLGFMAWRRRQQTEEESEGSVLATSKLHGTDLMANSVFGTTGGQAVNTGASIQTDFSQANLQAMDADEGVDPVAEADVYMAYGRDAQAEEILLDALKTDPNRPAIRLKLLEIYSGRRSVGQFDAVAKDLHQQTGGKGAEWEKAVALGLALNPGNPLYLDGSATKTMETPAFKPAEKLTAEAAASTVVISPAEAAKLKDTVTLPAKFGQEASKPEQAGVAQALDFDLDQELASGLDKATVETSTPQDTFSDIDFNLDLDLNPTEAEAKRNAFADTGKLQLNIQEKSPEVSAAPNLVAEPAQMADANAGGLDFEFDLDPPTQTPAVADKAPAPKAMPDLSAISLELDTPSSELNAVSDGLEDLSGEDDVPDVATKIELAQAYEEMGDKDGARELLQEVLSEGGMRQKALAEAKLAALDLS